MRIKTIIITAIIAIIISGAGLLLCGQYKTERFEGQFIRTEERLLQTGIHLAFVTNDGDRVQLKNINKLPEDINLNSDYIIEVKT